MSITGIQNSKASVKDVVEILELQKNAYLIEAKVYDDFTIQPLHQTIEEIRAEFEYQVFLKVEQGDHRISPGVREEWNMLYRQVNR